MHFLIVIVVLAATTVFFKRKLTYTWYHSRVSSQGLFQGTIGGLYSKYQLIRLWKTNIYRRCKSKSQLRCSTSIHVDFLLRLRNVDDRFVEVVGPSLTSKTAKKIKSRIGIVAILCDFIPCFKAVVFLYEQNRKIKERNLCLRQLFLLPSLLNILQQNSDNFLASEDFFKKNTCEQNKFGV